MTILKAQFYRISLFLLAVSVCNARADVMTYIYNAPESDMDVRYEFHWKILEMALQRTEAKYGAYKMIRSVVMSERRQVSELARSSGQLTVMFLDTNPELEKTLQPVRIPVDKGLVGYRVMLIRKEDVQLFATINTLDELRQFSFGLGLGWSDVDILKNSGFKVITGSSYDGLFDMLLHQRFDALSRGAVEILDEYDARNKMMPDLYIEPNIILYYPLPMYFWFAKTDDGKQLAARVEKGMWMMINDGSYDRIFEEYQGEKIARLKLKQRRIFKINNPLLVPETPFSDKRLWFNLENYQPGHVNGR